MFFRKTVIPEFDFSRIAIEMHNHILPGIDDGCNEVAESIEILRLLEKTGYRKVIFTPHVFSDLYPNSPDSINSALRMLKEAIALETVPLELKLEVSAEYMADDDLLERFVKTPPILINGTYILIEFSLFQAPLNYKEIIYELSLNGYKPIIAHPERYGYAADNLNFFVDLIDRGCLLQLNINSVLGGYGKSAFKLAKELLKLKMYELLGSDIHQVKQARVLSDPKIKRELTRHLGEYPFKNKLLLGGGAG
jgi:protein-tyrosine phosphatase